MKDLALITALTHLGSLENISLSLRKNKAVIHQPKVGLFWEKLCTPS